MTESEYITVADARDYLGVSKRKIAQLVAEGALPAEPNPLDKRSKVLRRADVEALKRKSPSSGPKRKEAA
jgi:hypothetical protein